MRSWREILAEVREEKAAQARKYDMRKYWRAVSYRQNHELPETLVRAHAFASVLDNLGIVLRDGEVFAGNPSGFFLPSLPESVSENDYLVAVKEHDERGQRDFWAGFDHSLGDYPTLMTMGLNGYIARAEESGGRDRAQSERDFLQSVIITLNAASRLATRYARACRSTGLIDAADALEWIAHNPPRTLREAMQLLWIIQIAFLSEGRYSMALGRIDQYLLPFYERDVEQGTLTRQDALDLFCYLWVKIEEIGEVSNIAIGGLTPDGRDGTNELSYICLDATRLVQSPNSNLSARFHDGSPERFHRACFDCIRTGVGFPAIFNDHVLIPGLEKIGVPAEAARDHCMVGCIETMLPGRQQAWSDSRFNTALTLDRAFRKLCESGERSYERLIELFRDQIVIDIAAHVDHINSYISNFPVEKFPDPFLSALTRHCIERARDINEGGAEFCRFHGIAIMGLATVADSLAVLKLLVFEEKQVSFDEVMAALDANFEGYDVLRHRLMENAPKYGNDDPYVDEIASSVVQWTTEECLRHTVHGGGRFVGGMAANIQNISAGREVGATPDGRLAQTPLSDAGSPYFGRDREGPTAFLHSISRPDYSKALLGSVVNMKFEPGLFQDEEGAARFSALTHFFVENRIQELQFNFTGNRTLLAARDNPREYANLVVRVSGFSAFFVTLDPEVQDDIIRRRAHA